MDRESDQLSLSDNLRSCRALSKVVPHCATIELPCDTTGIAPLLTVSLEDVGGSLANVAAHAWNRCSACALPG